MIEFLGKRCYLKFGSKLAIVIKKQTNYYKVLEIDKPVSAVYSDGQRLVGNLLDPPGQHFIFKVKGIFYDTDYIVLTGKVRRLKERRYLAQTVRISVPKSFQLKKTRYYYSRRSVPAHG